jgi:hypothetical protein
MVLVGYVRYRMGFPATNCNPLMGVRYDDLTQFLPIYRLLHTASFYSGHVAYPPLGAVVYAVVYGTGHPVGFYLWTAALWLTAGVWGVRRELMAAGIGGVVSTLFPLTVVLASFPLAGLLQRGNIELYLWIFAALGTWAYFRGYAAAAAVLWALAAAMKIYPVVFLLLLLPRRQWRAFGVGVATFVGATVASMAWMGPSIGVAWRGSLTNFLGFQSLAVTVWSLHELGANHSVFVVPKLVATMAGVPLSKVMLPYYACGAVVLVWAFFGRLWKMPVANQLLAVTVFMVLLPTISYFYTLVHLIAPLAVLVFVTLRAERAGVNIPGLRGTMMLFVPLFASFMLFTFPSVFVYGGMVQMVLLVLLFVCALQYPFAAVEAEAGAR